MLQPQNNYIQEIWKKPCFCIASYDRCDKCKQTHSTYMTSITSIWKTTFILAIGPQQWQH